LVEELGVKVLAEFRVFLNEYGSVLIKYVEFASKGFGSDKISSLPLSKIVNISKILPLLAKDIATGFSKVSNHLSDEFMIRQCD